MIGTPRRAAAEKKEWPTDRRPFERPAGPRLLVPGWPQFAWGQRERGFVLLASFLVGIGAAIMAWGTWLAWCFFTFAFVAHVTSASDAIRQGSFPVYSRRAALPVAAVLGATIYLPILLGLAVTAWPGAAQDRTRNVYLVNRWAYRGAAPRKGHWVWLRVPPTGHLHAARVVAVAGQEVEWNGHEWRIDGRRSRHVAPARSLAWPQICRFRVPPHQVLIEPEQEDEESTAATGSLVLVDQDQIIGRAWAQYYPVWDRRLL